MSPSSEFDAATHAIRKVMRRTFKRRSRARWWMQRHTGWPRPKGYFDARF